MNGGTSYFVLFFTVMFKFKKILHALAPPLVFAAKPEVTFSILKKKGKHCYDYNL